MYLSLDRNLVDGDKVVRSLYFSACCDGGRGCHSAVLRGDHHCDVVGWSRWSELGGVAQDMVWWSGGRSSAELLRTWSMWSELDGAAGDVVDVVAVDVVGARRSYSAARLMARRGSLSGSCGSLVGSAWLAYGLADSLDGSTWLI